MCLLLVGLLSLIGCADEVKKADLVVAPPRPITGRSSCAGDRLGGRAAE